MRTLDLHRWNQQPLDFSGESPSDKNLREYRERLNVRRAKQAAEKKRQMQREAFVANAALATIALAASLAAVKAYKKACITCPARLKPSP